MTKSSPAATDHWAVSTRTQGGVLTAGAVLPSIELVLLGIPGGFTPVEIQSWLRDLGGVAIETSRTDERSRPIPQLLHHALTGLLFSQTELWSHTGQALPCAAVFVHGPQGVAFGWVGRARVVLLVNGEPHEPQWVIVRDEAGQEAMSAALPADSHALLTLEYWPDGEDATQAPASLDAEWGQSFANLVSTTPAIAQPAPQPAVVVPAEPQARRSARPIGSLTPKVETVLPVGQPGLAPDPSIPLDEPDTTQGLPSTRHPSSGTFAMPTLPAPGAATSPVPPAPSSESTPAGNGPTDEAGHPVGRWLNKVIDFARRAVTKPESELEVAHAPAIAPQASEPARSVAPPAKAPMIAASSLEASPIAVPAPVVTRSAPPQHVVAPSASTAAKAPAPLAASTPKPAVTRAPEPPAKPAFPALESRPSPATAPRAGLATPPMSPRPGLVAAGLEEILGKRPPTSARGASGQRLEGLTATGIPSSTSGRATPPPEPEPTRSPYPVLDVTPVGPPARNPMQIEREPVGADSTFAIPRLPSLAPTRAPKVSVPTAADMMRRDAEAAARRAAPPPAAPVASAPVAPPAAAPAAVTPEPVLPAVPEPPAEFLEEFAASAPTTPSVPVEEPPAEEWRNPVTVVSPTPVVETPVAPVEPAVVEAPPAAEPIVPRGVSIVMQRPNLPSMHRAAAVSAPTPPPPPPTAAEPEPGTPVLRVPTTAEPVPVAESEVSTLLRELPLPAVPAEEDPDAVPEGMLIATPSTGMPSRRYGRNEWPELGGGETTRVPAWRNPTIIGAVVTVLFGIGWIVGHSQSADNDIHSTPMSRMLRSVGLGGARFTTAIETDPPGAFIAIDGKPISRRTPSTIELMPGDYKVTLSLPDLGEVVVPLSGKARQKVQVSEPLHGSLDVTALDNSVPVKMSLDGEPKGFLPVHVEQLPPGLHEVQFSGPNMQPWGQTVNIGIRQNATLKARPMMSPATGVVVVQASLNDEGGTAPLEGATVYVDGEARGQTPLTMDLPRGPHSLKVTFRGETAPIQVLDLPGGNKRYASFQFGLDSDLPPLKLNSAYSALSGRKSTLVEASLANLDWHDLREAWLHVRTGEGLWRRYQMTISEGANGALLSADFPTNAFDASGRVMWYMSAATAQGDEFHTEMQRSSRSP